jgi:TIR domain-containing protein
MSHVFISYSHKDSDYAHKLTEALRKNGFAPWMDEDIDYGDRWISTITQAIRDSSCVMVIMSPAAEESEWVEKEILIAQREKKRIFPLLLQGKEFPLLINVQSVNVAGGVMPPQVFFDEKLAKVAPRAARPVPEQRPMQNPVPQIRNRAIGESPAYLKSGGAAPRLINSADPPWDRVTFRFLLLVAFFVPYLAIPFVLTKARKSEAKRDQAIWLITVAVISLILIIVSLLLPRTR